MDWKNVSRSFSLIDASIGAVGFAGWVFDIDALKRIHPTWVTMKANTGLCVILAGFAIALLRDENVGGFRLRVAQVCAILIATTGFVTFGEHVNWWNTGIDQALFLESAASAGRSFPGRMNPASTLNFMLLGVGILLLDARPRRGCWLSQICAVAVIGITFIIFLIYFYEVEIPHNLEVYLSIALHTALAFLLLAGAMLLARPRRGIMAVFLAENIGGVIARRMLPAALFLPALIGWACAMARNAGYLGRGVGLAILATSLTLIFTALVWWAARALAEADSKRRAAEASRERLAAIVEFSTDGIVSKNLDGIVTSWNPGAERLFGFASHEMVGQSITRIIPPERHGEETDILRRLRRGEVIEHFETVRVSKDGKSLDVSVTISPMREAGGKIVGASKIVRDITGRKQAEAALAQQREWFAVTLSSIGDAVIATDEKGAVSFLNPIAESMTGWSSSEAAGRPLEEVFHIVNETTRAPAENPIARVLREGTVIGLANHTVLIARDGREICIDDSAAPIRDFRGNVVGTVMVFHDVTERRRVAAELAQARDAAEAANRAKDDFLAVLSHELRTPLTPALLATAELESSPPSDPAVLRESLALIRRNIELEARLVDDLLDVTRISRGKLRIASAPVDLHVALRDSLAMAGPLLREKHIGVASDFAAPHHLVRGDAARLAQIFSNLLTNSAKFTPESGRVTIRTENHDGTVRIEVRDTGIGIPADVLPKIFEPFRQGEIGTTRRFGGLGLGLSVAKSLVEAHGGTIEARSEGTNLGATFCITLPALDGTALDVEVRGSSTEPAAPTRPLRVLLVEDHQDTRDVLLRLMRRWGHTVTVATSVAQARGILASQHFDLLLSDIGLPDGSGLEVVAALREKSDIPAVAMSGYGMESDLANARAAGFTEHLVKPVAIEALRDLLTRLSPAPDRPETRG